MSTWEFRLMHLANLLVTGTGLVYGVLKYFMILEGEYGPEPHAAQADWQHLHVLTAPFLALMLGAFWKAHASHLLKKKFKEGRRTGIGMMWFIVPMVFSGYLIQVAMSDVWRTVFVWMHLAVSGLWIAAYALHWWSHFRRSKR
jgi:hypothetical protein